MNEALLLVVITGSTASNGPITAVITGWKFTLRRYYYSSTSVKITDSNSTLPVTITHTGQAVLELFSYYAY